MYCGLARGVKAAAAPRLDEPVQHRLPEEQITTPALKSLTTVSESESSLVSPCPCTRGLSEDWRKIWDCRTRAAPLACSIIMLVISCISAPSQKLAVSVLPCLQRLWLQSAGDLCMKIPGCLKWDCRTWAAPLACSINMVAVSCVCAQSQRMTLPRLKITDWVVESDRCWACNPHIF